jgi:hypothetical protein
MQTVIPHRPRRVGTAEPFHAAMFFPPWIPSESSDRLHLVLVLLHTAGAIGAYLMSTLCEVIPANQQAMVPARMDRVLYTAASLKAAEITQGQVFRAAFLLAQDSPFVTHVWNPYILVASFEWITAAFAMCTIRHWIRSIREWVLGWLVVGAAGTVVWYARHYVFSSTEGAKLSIAMGIILGFSYGAAGVICSKYIEMENTIDPLAPREEQAFPDESHETDPPPDAQWQASGHGTAATKRVLVQGRPW